MHSVTTAEIIPTVQLANLLFCPAFRLLSKGMTSGSTRTIWRNADAVCFDVDSTVIKEEGIDELAKFCGKGSDVQALLVTIFH